HIFCLETIWQIRLFNKHFFPLSALRFVTGYSITEFDLQSVEIFIFMDFFLLFPMRNYLFIIQCHLLKKSLIFFISQRRAFRSERVEQNNSIKRRNIRIVNQSCLYLGKPKSV